MAKSRSSIAERASDDDDDDDDDDSLRCRLRADAHPSTADPEVWKGARRWGEVCGEGVLTRTGTITGGGYAPSQKFDFVKLRDLVHSEVYF